MKKSILAILLSVVMLLTIPVSAETLSEFFANYPIPASYEMDVKADIQVKRAAGSTFVDGPINVKKKVSSDEWPAFDFKATLYMDSVRTAFSNYTSVAKVLIADDNALLDSFEQMPVYGGFEVSVTYPSSLRLPKDFISASDMEGFNEEAKAVFREISREETVSGKWKTFIVKIAVKSVDGTQEFITEKELEDNLETYLADFTFTCENVKTSDYGSFPVYGAVTGFTDIGDESEGAENITSLSYTGVQLPGGNTSDALSATVKVVKDYAGSPIGPTGGTGGTVYPTEKDDDVTISFDVGGNTIAVDAVNGTNVASVDLSKIEKPVKEGYVFVGWYSDPGMTKPVTGVVTVSKDTVLYGKWISTKAPEVLNDSEHVAYIRGYEDGTVRPEKAVTREEIATILYRLLDKEHRDSIYTEKSIFADVLPERWSSTAVATMANGGYLKGYPDGTFAPEKAVSRAEFVTIINRFYGDELLSTGIGFYDAAGHWAEENIISAAARGWIDGYEDGSFRPDISVSRAEAMTILNRILVRHTDNDGLFEDVKNWPDNSADAWYYYDVMEATVHHDYTRREDGAFEDWTKVYETSVWPD